MWFVLMGAMPLASVVGFGLAVSGDVTTAMALHAALMITAWSFLIPAGSVVARYFKVMPGQDFPRVVENLTWWRWHRGLQYGGIILSTAGLGVILAETGDSFDTLHGRCGLAVMALGWLQVFSALLRGSKGGPTDRRADLRSPATWRGDHYDMTPRRRAFEAWHKPAGWAVIVLAGITVLLGLQLTGTPPWLLCVVGVLQAGVCLGIVDGVARRRWVDTYASLWGFDSRQPESRPSAGEERPTTRALFDHVP